MQIRQWYYPLRRITSSADILLYPETGSWQPQETIMKMVWEFQFNITGLKTPTGRS